MYKTKDLTNGQLAQLREGVRKEIEALKVDSDNYADDLYEVFAENDSLLFDLAQKDLAKAKAAEPAPVPTPAPVPMPVPMPVEVPKAVEKTPEQIAKGKEFAEKMAAAREKKAAEKPTKKEDEKPKEVEKPKAAEKPKAEPKAKYGKGDSVTVKDGDFKDDPFTVKSMQLDGDTYLYDLDGETPMKNVSEGRLKDFVVKPMKRTSKDEAYKMGDWAMWYGSPVVIASVKPRGESFEYEVFDGAQLQKAFHGDLEAMEGQLEYIGEVRIGCDMKAYRNATGKVMTVNNINGQLKVAPGDAILFLPENNHSFTNIKDENFFKRCVIVKEAKDDTPMPVTPAKLDQMVEDSEASAAMPKEAKKAAKKDVKAAKAAKKASQGDDNIPADVAKDIKQSTENMAKEGCDVAHFIKETKGTPIHDYLMGEVSRFNMGNAEDKKYKVTRIGINKKGQYIAEMSKLGSILSIHLDTYYFRVCPESGSETLLSKAEGEEAYEAFENREMKIQFSKDLVNKIYNRGMEFDTCTKLAKEAYVEHKEGKLAKFREKCLNTNLLAYYKEKNKVVHEHAHELRKRSYYKDMSHHEVASIVRKRMKSDYRVHGIRVKR